MKHRLAHFFTYAKFNKWVNPAGTLEEASEATSPEVLSLVRSSYGLCGIVYEVTLKIKPLEMVKFNYLLTWSQKSKVSRLERSF
jgi:hypothetical protein